MIGLLDPFGAERSRCLTARVGHWTADPPLSPETLEDRLTCLEGEKKKGFLTLLRSMMKWRPEERKTACQLLDDPWLQTE